jgi:tetratricopeptide (TPR) repeat protein
LDLKGVIVFEKDSDGFHILRRSQVNVMTIFLKMILKLAKETEKSANCLILLALVLVLAGFSRTGLCAESVQDVKSLFSAAQANFELGLLQEGERKRALMIKSAGQFRALIHDHRIDNGNLYYNMGNAYFEAGEVGKAILSYRQAEKLLPGSSDLQYNLNQARNKLNLPQPTQGWWKNIMKGLFFWHYMMEYELRRSMLLTVFSLVWI